MLFCFASFALLNNNNLICIIDHNKSTNRALIVDDLRKKFISFGWDAFTINGHNEKLLLKTIKKQKKKPLAIIAKTIKGKGVSFMEKVPMWHHRKIKDFEYEIALNELMRNP